MQNDLEALGRDLNQLPSELQSLLWNISALAASMQMPCYVVGGFVRDVLLGRLLHDFDIVVEADAIALGRALAKHHGGALTVHRKFLTCTWQVPTPQGEPIAIDLITARTERYSAPGVLPAVRAATIDDDLRRRDFTINAMALRLEGESFAELLDPLNGQADLVQRKIRVLHARSFQDDPTRILRAIRYEARYGFAIDTETAKLIDNESLATLAHLSGERVRHEFDLILYEAACFQSLQRAADFGVFAAFDPKLPRPRSELTQAFGPVPPTELALPTDEVTFRYCLWLIELDSAALETIARRFDFKAGLRDTIQSAASLQADVPELSGSKPSRWTLRLQHVPQLAVFAVWSITNESALLDYLQTWRHVHPQTNAAVLIARGIPPGPRIGELLTRLRAAWLDGEISSPQDESRLLADLTR